MTDSTVTGQPAPFAPPPLQRLHHYYEAVRPFVSPFGTRPSRFPPLGVSLTQPGKPGRTAEA
ncbi:hypothetical protein FMEAI12_6060002 [Parafrankia sp. Ea1.12]|nr:hypothetical protein FMEAI12_6060002 [Parafrankia sp. Ea1.12]